MSTEGVRSCEDGGGWSGQPWHSPPGVWRAQDGWTSQGHGKNPSEQRTHHLEGGASQDRTQWNVRGLMKKKGCKKVEVKQLMTCVIFNFAKFQVVFPSRANPTLR